MVIGFGCIANMVIGQQSMFASYSNIFFNMLHFESEMIYKIAEMFGTYPIQHLVRDGHWQPHLNLSFIVGATLYLGKPLMRALGKLSIN